MKTKIMVVCFTMLAATSLCAAELAYTYKDIQLLKKTNPEVANAFLKGVASTAYVFRVVESGKYLFCPPKGTRIDQQLVELVVDSEIRIHNASADDWYHELVRKGFERAYPCN